MNKIKSFISSNKIIFIILAVALVGVVTLTVIYFSVKQSKPQSNEFIPTGTQANSKELEEVSNFIAPNEADIVVDKAGSSSPSSTVSSETSSKKVTLKVDGNASSKVTSSKPQIDVKGNASNKPVSSKPTESKPKLPVSSEPTSIPPVSSEPTEPVTPPYNPDGPQHGDTTLSDYTGQTVL